MHGTLIGAFITSLGIVIGADTRVSGPEVPPGKEVGKTCQPTARSVAALQGWYGWPAISGLEAQLLSRFHRTCGDLSGRPTAPLEAQADEFMRALEREANPYLQLVPSTFVPPHGKGELHLNYLTVAGYGPTGPSVIVRELRLLNVGARWAAVRRTSKLSFSACGAKFHGEAIVADLLLSNDVRIPATERQRPEVLAGRRPGVGCSAFTPELARRLFQTAIRLTNELGPKLGVPAGRVGGRLQVYLVQPNRVVQLDGPPSPRVTSGK